MIIQNIFKYFVLEYKKKTYIFYNTVQKFEVQMFIV